MMRSWLKWTGAVAAALTLASPAMAADHRDAPGTTADPTTDINDVYAFTVDTQLIMAMTVFPVADDTSKFSDTVQYVFNLDTGSTFGTTLEGKKVLCTFDTAQLASCYFGTPGQQSEDWLSGDVSAEGGITSKSGKFKVFAGLRSDPFFFNLDGFKDAVLTVENSAGALTFDLANCPNVNAQTSAVLVGMLQGTNQGADPAQDFFLALNTLAIVVSIDKSLLNPDHGLVSIWASTHQAP
jgi:hypothetical protein